MTSSVEPRIDVGPQPIADLPDLERRNVPARTFAWIGVGFILLQIYIFTAWVLGDHFVRTDTGPDEAPAWMEAVLGGWQVLGWPALLGFCYVVVIRPWRRNGHLSNDGIMVLAFTTVYWQDPVINFAQNWSTYNSIFFNRGSWSLEVPFWVAPNSNQFAEPLLWAFPAYLYVVFGAVMFGGFVMRKTKERFPSITPLGLVGVCFLFFLVFDLTLESTMMRLGLYSYTGAIEWLTLFPGKYYQFPVYEAVFWGGTWTLWASLRYFRNDKGETVCERGSSEMRVNARKRTGIRFLALAGMFNLIFLFGYNVPIAFFAMHADDWPQDIRDRSYLTDLLCGEGTDYECSGPEVPIPRRGSFYLTPEGDLRAPDGSTYRVVPEDDAASRTVDDDAASPAVDADP